MKTKKYLEKLKDDLPLFYRNINTKKVNKDSIKPMRVDVFPAYQAGSAECSDYHKPISRIIYGARSK